MLFLNTFAASEFIASTGLGSRNRKMSPCTMCRTCIAKCIDCSQSLENALQSLQIVLQSAQIADAKCIDCNAIYDTFLAVSGYTAEAEKKKDFNFSSDRVLQTGIPTEQS